MKKLKLIKFRSLADDTELELIKNIIINNSFWCSKLWKLNDPMEGVFSTYSYDQIEKIFSGKNNIVICSFSGEKALKNPLMWGYYANGFKGIAIETEVKINNSNSVISNSDRVTNGKIVPVIYDNKSFSSGNELTIEQIMTRKLEDWKHEDEYRFLKVGRERLYKIGEINKIYFGAPYYNVNNRKKIIENSVPLQKYEDCKNKLEDFCKTFNKRIGLEDYRHGEGTN